MSFVPHGYHGSNSLEGFTNTPREGCRQSAVVQDGRRMLGQPGCSFHVLAGLLRPVHSPKRPAAIMMGLEETRLQRERACHLFVGGVVAPFKEMNPARDQVENDRQWIQLERAPALF